MDGVLIRWSVGNFNKDQKPLRQSWFGALIFNISFLLDNHRQNDFYLGQACSSLVVSDVPQKKKKTFSAKPFSPPLTLSFYPHHRQYKNQVTLPLLDTVSKTLCVVNIIEDSVSKPHIEKSPLMLVIENKLVYFQHHYHSVQFTVLTPCG